MPTPQNLPVRRIVPLSAWPNCFLVVGLQKQIILGCHNGRWNYGTDPDQVCRGRGVEIAVVEGYDDLISAGNMALNLAEQPAVEAEIMQRQTRLRGSSAARWAALITRGASGTGPRGTESSGEHLMVVAAGQMLTNGDPVLTILDRYSLEELIAIRTAMNGIGRDGWYYPLVDRQN